MNMSAKGEINELVERLNWLLADATKGDWELQDGCSWRRIGTRGHNGNVLCPSTYSREDNHPDLTAGRGEDLYSNLQLIVEMKNGLPSLLQAITDLQAENERLREEIDDALSEAIGNIDSGISELKGAKTRIDFHREQLNPDNH